MGFGRLARWVSVIRPWVAAGGAMLVFALGLFAASPTLHEQLHHGAAAATDDGCAIVLFANGVSVPVTAIDLPPVPVARSEQVFLGATEIVWDSPRYLHQPERGPPVA